MAQNKIKSSKGLPEKESKKKIVSKTKQPQERNTADTAKSKIPQANLRRGKLPANWNIYVNKHKTTHPDKAVSKFPKNLTSPKKSTRHAKVDQQKNVKMGPYINLYSTGMSTGRCVAIDCEMVGIGDGRENMLARVSLVDENGSVVYDTFVKAQQEVTDYRTAVSGVRPYDMKHGREFSIVQAEVYNIIKGKLLIGHAIRNDLRVLFLSHPRKYIRDSSKFNKFRDEASGHTPSLKFLASHLLGMNIQHGEHSSIEDARAAMFLYMKYRNHWESELRTRFYK